VASTVIKALLGFDHGAGHPLLLLGNTNAHNYRNNNMLNKFYHYSKWPKVADAVIKATRLSHLLALFHEVSNLAVSRVP